MKHAVLVVLFALASAAAHALEPIRVISLPTRLSALEGLEVLDFAGRRLGRVAELTVDMANARVRHALVQTASGESVAAYTDELAAAR